MPTWVIALIDVLSAVITDVQAILAAGSPSPASLMKLQEYSQYISSANELLAFHVSQAAASASDKSE